MTQSDEALLQASGLFDADFYASQNVEALGDGTDPLRHFCRAGWKELLRPRPDFDVWWYWTNYLDPRSEAINPFLHYVTEGREAGLRGLPPSTHSRPGEALRSGGRRICLFAGHDPQSILDEHVVRYVRELSQFADVYYLADCYLPRSELARLDGLARGAWAVPHGGYDFGSFALLARELVGWHTIEQYDELLLVNDGCYLLTPLDDVFEQMSSRPVDWWGLQATKGLSITADAPSNAFRESIPLDVVREEMLREFERDPVYDFHVSPYFAAYRGRVLEDPRFRRIIDSAGPQPNKLTVIQKYEAGLAHYLVGNGYSFDAYEPWLHPLHPMYSERAFDMVDRGFPLLKRSLLSRNPYDVPLQDWKERVLAAAPDAPVDLFEQNLVRTSAHDRLARAFSVRRLEDGRVEVPQVVRRAKFRRQDEATPKDENCWAFPVCPDDHTLPANSRALIEETRSDTSITRVVLSRSRRIELPDPDVIVVPLRSPEGQQHLMRAGQVFVKRDARRSLGTHVAAEHRLFLVRDGLILSRPGAVKKRPARVDRDPVSPWHAVLSASDVDQLAVLAVTYPTRYDQCWRTGIPAHDFLVRGHDELPKDLAEDESRLREELDGRRLLLVVPELAREPRNEAFAFSAEEVSWLRRWSERTGTAIGLREHPLDRERRSSRALEGLAIDLSVHRYAALHPLLRAAGAVLTDHSGIAMDFMATGRPVVSYSPHLESVAKTLLYDLQHVFPGPVCLSFGELTTALEGVFEEKDAAYQHRYERIRQMFLGHTGDGVSSRRVAARVKATYGGQST